MKIHQLRNATFVIESKDHFILIDPMLCAKGQLPPFSRFKHKVQNNPTVPLPANSAEILNKVTHCLITHSQKWGIEALTPYRPLGQSRKKIFTKTSNTRCLSQK